MNRINCLVFFVVSAASALVSRGAATIDAPAPSAAGKVADKPLFRDPVLDGAAYTQLLATQ